MGVKEIESKTGKSNFGDIFNTVILSFMIFIIGLRIFPFALLVLPAPSIVLAYKNGINYGVIASFITTLGIYLIEQSSIFGIIFLLYLVPTVVIISTMLKAEEKTNKIVMVNSIALLVITAVVFVNIQFILKVDILTSIKDYFNEFIKLIPELFSKAGTEYVEMITTVIREYSKIFIKSILSTIVLLSVGISYFSFVFSRSLLRKRNIILKQNDRFNEFRVSRIVTIPIVIVGIIVFILNYYKIQYSDIISLNIYILIKILFTISGVALVDYFLSNKINRFLRIFIPIAIFLMGLEIIYFVIGLADTVVNFRKLMNRNLK